MSLITSSLLKLIISDQRKEKIFPDNYISRTCEEKLAVLAQNKEIVILSGLRRCGKSVLLNFVKRNVEKSDYYFNFEDERLVNFTVEDFQLLYETFIELYGEQTNFFFDEIQNIEGWEMFVRRLYNNGNKVFITGSNANLLSAELGTKLTGRYIPLAIFPISFLEYVNHIHPEIRAIKNFDTGVIGRLKKCYNEYLEIGGIPEFIKNRQSDYLTTLYENIIYRDIVARYKISNVQAIKKLVFYLASNISKEITFNSMKGFLALKSVTTISEYCGYLENSYLCFFVHRYSDSLKKQLQSPKKVYFIDIAMTRLVGFRNTSDDGRILENVVYLELKRRSYEIFYYNEEKECDFIVMKDKQVIQAIQVCYEMELGATKNRELNGLIEALDRFDLNEGFIVTNSQESIEEIELKDRKVKVHIIPIWKFLLSRT